MKQLDMERCRRMIGSGQSSMSIGTGCSQGEVVHTDVTDSRLLDAPNTNSSTHVFSNFRDNSARIPHITRHVSPQVGVKREESGWMRCITRDRTEARGQRPLTPLVCPSFNVLQAHPRQRSDRAHKSRRPSRSPREPPQAQLRNELPSTYKYK